MTSTLTIFPPISVENARIIPCGQNVFPSKAFIMLGDGISVEDLRPFQQLIDITQVEAPSSTTVLHMVEPVWLDSICMEL